MPVSTSKGKRAAAVALPEPVARYISQQEAAERWSVSVDVVWRLISASKVTGYWLNNRIIRVDVAEVDAAFRPIPTVRTVA